MGVSDRLFERQRISADIRRPELDLRGSDVGELCNWETHGSDDADDHHDD
jgi:hypothetical protein